MTAVYLFVIFAANFAQIAVAEAPKTLKLVSLLYRHGDRTPITGLPSFNDSVADWPQGFGQLTTVGMQQEYNLGKLIRQRYDGYLNKKYLQNEIYVSSTDVDRCLMSAQCVLTSLYPPVDEQVWNPDIKWQPIPVHTTPTQNDMMFAKASCEKLDKQRQKIAQSPVVFNQLRQQYGEFIEDIYNKSGFKISLVNSSNPFALIGSIRDNIRIREFLSSLVTRAGFSFDEDDNSSYTFDNEYLRHTIDVIIIRTIHNKTLPAWVTDEVRDKLDKILPILRTAQNSDHLVRKYMGGPLLTKMVTDMKLRADGILEPHMKMFMYSAHDTTVMSLLSALDIYNYTHIPYSTMVTVELHQHLDSKEFYVQVWYKPGSVPQLMKIPGCEANCTLEKFVNLTSSMMVSDRYRECVLYTALGFTSYQSKVVFITLVGSVLLASLLLCMGILCHKKCGRGTRSVKYRIHENTELPESLPMINSGGGLSDED